MAMIPYMLSCAISYGGLYLAYRIALKVASRTKAMQKIKSLLNTKEIQAGILAGVLINLVMKFLRLP